MFSPYVTAIDEILNPDGDLRTGVTIYFSKFWFDVYETAINHFTQWAFVYCGMYGYPYFECGDRVRRLFRKKNWFAVSKGQVMGGVFMICVVSIGFLNIRVGDYLVENTDWFEDAKKSASFDAQV